MKPFYSTSSQQRLAFWVRQQYFRVAIARSMAMHSDMALKRIDDMQALDKAGNVFESTSNFR